LDDTLPTAFLTWYSDRRDDSLQPQFKCPVFVQLQAQVTAAEEAERPFAAAAAAGAAAGGASSAYSPAADKVLAKLEPHHAAVGAQFQLLFS
jgi:hypothetical protein